MIWRRICPECGEPNYSDKTEYEFWRCLKCGNKINMEFQEPIAGKQFSFTELLYDIACLRYKLYLLEEENEKLKQRLDISKTVGRGERLTI